MFTKKKYRELNRQKLREKDKIYKLKNKCRFICDLCNFKHSIKKYFEKHCNTNKHKKRISIPNDIIEIFFKFD